jgi:hypothetical protein
MSYSIPSSALIKELNVLPSLDSIQFILLWSQSYCLGPEIGEDSQICRLDGCLLSTYVPCGTVRVKTPSCIDISRFVLKPGRETDRIRYIQHQRPSETPQHTQDSPKYRPECLQKSLRKVLLEIALCSWAISDYYRSGVRPRKWRGGKCGSTTAWEAELRLEQSITINRILRETWIGGGADEVMHSASEASWILNWWWNCGLTLRNDVWPRQKLRRVPLWCSDFATSIR